MNNPVKKLLTKKDKTNTLHGYKVTPAQEEIVPVARTFIQALARQNWEQLKAVCPGSLIPRLQMLPTIFRLDDVSLVKIEASDSFGILVTEGIQRHDGRSDQLGLTFVVYPHGKWIFQDIDWLGPENQDEFIEGFRQNYPNVETKYVQQIQLMKISR